MFGNDEIEEIQKRYERRRERDADALFTGFSAYQHYRLAELEYWLSDRIQRRFAGPRDLKVLEVGAGTGYFVGYFRRFGFAPKQIWAAELLSERLPGLHAWLDSEHVLHGDASTMTFPEKYDVILQSTVFSSILDSVTKKRLAENMWQALKPGGIVLWYDFWMNNPRNPDVRGVPWSEVKALFPAAELWKHKVTLAPPIGRRVGRLYPYLNFPFLRTHIVAELRYPVPVAEAAR